MLGAAALTTLMMQGSTPAYVSALIEQSDTEPAAKLFDRSILWQLAFDRDQALALQEVAIAAAPILRVRQAGSSDVAIRLLALLSPGDMMANTPIDFITRHLNVQLDLLFIVPGQTLPATIPDHDLMFFAATEPDAATLARMVRLFDNWPRPVLNDPVLLPSLARDKLPALLSAYPGICSPITTEITQAGLGRLARGEDDLGDVVAGATYPVLVRPTGSHAGIGLQRIDCLSELTRYAQGNSAPAYFVTVFKDYRGPDGFYRKLRIALMEGKPYLCHQAASEHWMVHYLNAGMDACPAKRADEAMAMDQFRVFAERHHETFAELYRLLPFDYFLIDCAELPDGRLLVFEADTAAIVHLMEPAAGYPYKHVHMPRVFEAFEAMLRRRALSSRPSLEPRTL